MLPSMPNFYDAVYTLVRDIPPGRVMTYGQIATILGAPRAARAVGYALRALGPGTDVPWQRVINSKGGISARGDVERPTLQYELLEEEGVPFGADGTCDLARHRWEPERPEDYHFTPGEAMPF
jgi:methylated-DNA-protein-cysteine methyltransferase-like protein